MSILTALNLSLVLWSVVSLRDPYLTQFVLASLLMICHFLWTQMWFYLPMMPPLSWHVTHLLGLQTKLTNSFSDLSAYLNMSQLVPNSSKSKLMAFKSRSLPELPNINFYGEAIEWVTEFKYLGITLTGTMSFSKHIYNISNKVSQVTGTLLKFCTAMGFDQIILCFGLPPPKCQHNSVGFGTSISFEAIKNKDI